MKILKMIIYLLDKKVLTNVQDTNPKDVHS